MVPRRLALLPLLLLAPHLALAGEKYPGHPVTSVEIKGADLLARDRAISDDAFEGRGPGTKNGAPVDLEAVIKIPFRAPKTVF